MSGDARRACLRDECGAVAIYAALSFLVIIAMLAFIVDVGMSAATKRKVQAAVDAGALAGCDQLIETPTRPDLVQQAARSAVLANAVGTLDGLTAADVTVDIEGGALAGGAGVTPSVRVRVDTVEPLIFGAAMGRANVALSGDSTAAAQKVKGARYVAPFGLPILGTPSAVRYEVRTGAGAVVAAGPLTATSADMLTWGADITAPAAPGGYDVYVIYANRHGAEDTLYDTYRRRQAPAARLIVRGAGVPVTDVTAAGPLFLQIDSYSRGALLPNVRVLTPTGNFGVPLTIHADPLAYQLMAGYPAIYSGFPVAYVYVTSPDNPVRSVSLVAPVVNGGQTTRLTASFSGYDPRDWTFTRPGGVEKTYYLRADGNGEFAGDVLPLTLASVNHASCGGQRVPASSIPGSEADWALHGYPGSLHAGDVVSAAPSRYATGLRGFLGTGPRGSYANMPVLMRSPTGGWRVEGFVTAFTASNAFLPVTQVTFPGDYVATPHEFEDGVPTSGTNAVFAARLVRP